MPKGDPIVSPWTYDSGGDSQGRRITISVAYNNTTRLILGADVHRDSGCFYHKILLGLGPDGTPDTSTHQFDLTSVSGDLHVTPAQIIASAGVTTIEDITSLGQVTAGF